MNKERERERTQRETKKKRKERRSMFFLSSSSSYLWYLFSRIRAMIESNRGRFSCIFFFVLVLLLLSSSSRRLSRGTREKSYDEEIEKKPFLIRVFSIFSNSHPSLMTHQDYYYNLQQLRKRDVRSSHLRKIKIKTNASYIWPFHCVVVLREYRVRRTHNRDEYNDTFF